MEEKIRVVFRRPSEDDDPEFLKSLLAAEAKAAKSVENAKVRLVMSDDGNGCFFGCCALHLRQAPRWSIPTAATDGRWLYYNPDFINSLTPAEVTGLVAHEVMHCTNNHQGRRGVRDRSGFNTACDLSINDILQDAKYKLPDGGFFPGKGLFAAMPKGLCAEEYYTLLPASMKDGSGLLDFGGCGAVIEPTNDDGTPATDVDYEILRREWDNITANATASAQGKGNLHAGIDRMLGTIPRAAHDWRAELRSHCSMFSRTGQDWKRPNRRHAHSGVFIPSVRSKKIRHVVCAFDTSGSISQEVQARFASEIFDIASQGVSRLTILYHTCKVYKVYEWEPDMGELKIDGGQSGGTSHIPVFKWVSDLTEPPDMVVSLTDMESDFPKHGPDCAVLFACVRNSRAVAPFGSLIHIPV